MMEQNPDKKVFIGSGLLSVTVFLLFVSIITAILDHRDGAKNATPESSKIEKKEAKDAKEEKKTYTVSKGDTLSEISEKTGISVEEIKKINNLTSNNLNIGQELKLSGGERKQQENKKEEPKAKEGIYKVKRGDSLYKISLETKVSVQKLKKINNLTSNNLNIGQELKLD